MLGLIAARAILVPMSQVQLQLAAGRIPALALRGRGPAHERAAWLLAELGVRALRLPGPDSPPAALEWARSGAMALTGWPQAAPLAAPGPLASAARGAALAFEALCGWSGEPLDGAALLGERAALLGLARGGRISPGGACRLLRARDGWLAVQLAREDDIAALPAWLELDAGSAARASDAWTLAGSCVRARGCAELVLRARLLGLPAAAAVPLAAQPPPWLRASAVGAAVAPRPASATPLVVDLSSLWAGPLAGALLLRAGARVWKVESQSRPDGARAGSPAFYELLNAGKRSAALDLREPAGRRALWALLERADIALESARPRALQQLGIDAREWLRARPGRSWVSITGYGRREPEAGWVAFGDDAGVAAGLAAATGGPQAPLFCGDAIADPLTGLHAAVAAWASWRAGGGQLLDLSLRDVAAACAAAPPAAEADADSAAAALEPAAAPRARVPIGRAAALGADTAELLAEAGAAC